MSGSGSGRRRRRSGTKKARKWLPWVVGGIIVILLANVGMALSGMMGGDKPSGFLTPRLIRWVGLWVPVSAAVAAVVAGFVWTSQALERRERNSSRWQRRSFVLALVGLCVLIAMRMDPQSFPIEGRTETAIGVLAAVLGMFAWSTRKDQTVSSRRRTPRDTEPDEAGDGATPSNDPEAEDTSELST